jgi:hypothetical protein
MHSPIIKTAFPFIGREAGKLARFAEDDLASL